MEKSTQMGMNRTGIDISPVHSKAMIRGARELTPDVKETSRQSLSAIERQYIESAGPVGSVPVPATIKGALKSAMDKFTGRNPEILINKLGERLAFERSGVRLYDSVIRRCEALSSMQGRESLPVEQLVEIRNEEAEHFRILKDAMEDMGADPTAQTPDADVSGTIGLGFQKVLTDPRTSISQCLETLLGVELLDNAAWELLIALSEELGMDEMADRFRHALRQEETHVQRIRAWYEAAVLTQSGRSTDTQH